MKKAAQDTLKKCLLQEKEGLDFYRKACETVIKERTRKALDVLIREEKDHIRRLFEEYRGKELGDLDSFLNRPPKFESAIIKELEGALEEDLADRKAMEIAMRLENENRKNYLRHAQETKDPEIRGIFERLASDEEAHFEVVESEYAHLMAMVHETDVNIYVRE